MSPQWIFANLVTQLHTVEKHIAMALEAVVEGRSRARISTHLRYVLLILALLKLLVMAALHEAPDDEE